MDLTHGNTSGVQIGDAGTARSGRVKVAAGIMAVAVIAALLAATLIDQSRGNAPTTKSDPLVGAAAVEFRAGERVLSGTSTDPLVGPAAVEFRAGEREGATSTDPLVRPAAVEFRAGEREGARQ